MDERSPRSDRDEIERTSEEDVVGSAQDDDFEDVDDMEDDDDTEDIAEDLEE